MNIKPPDSHLLNNQNGHNQETGKHINVPGPMLDCGDGMIESLQEKQFYQIFE